MTLLELQWISARAMISILVLLALCFAGSIYERLQRGESFSDIWIDQTYTLKRSESILILLNLELAIFFASFVAVFCCEGREKAADFFAYGAPCAAGIIVGVGIVIKGMNEPPNLDPFRSLDYKYYVYSIIFLFMSLFGYFFVHFNSWTVSWVAVSFCGLTSVAYLAALAISDFNQPVLVKQPISLKVAERIIWLGLLFMTSLLAWFVAHNRSWLSSPPIEETAKCCCKPSEHEGQEQDIGKDAQKSRIICRTSLGFHNVIPCDFLRSISSSVKVKGEAPIRAEQ
jgi:hypothetical protein